MLLLQVIVKTNLDCFRKKVMTYLGNERGELMGTIGWMALLATVLVIIHGLLTGWIDGFVESVFAQMEKLTES